MPTKQLEKRLQGNIELTDTDFELTCVEQEQTVRPRMEKPITEHFSLGLPGGDTSAETNTELVKQFINKMELVFKKVKKGIK